MQCHLLLEDRTGSNDENYNFNGNVLLDRLHGATVSKRPGGADMQAEMEKLADELRRRREEALRHPRRRQQSGRRARLRERRARDRLPGDGDGPEHRHRRARHGKRRHAGRPGDRLQGARRPGSGARHRRARAQGKAGGERLQPGEANRRPHRARRHRRALRRGCQLRLCRSRLRPADAGHGRGRHAARAHWKAYFSTRSIPARAWTA